MRTMRLFGLLGLLGCSDPSTGGTPLTCDPSHGCPDGFSCIGGRCVMSVSGQGCAGSGYDVSRISGTVYACSGSYAVGGAGALCATGYSICTSASSIEYVTCEVLPGFYLSATPARQIPAGSGFIYQCDAASVNPISNQTPGWAGCGGKNVVGVQTVQSCMGGFVQAQIGVAQSGLSVNKDATGYVPIIPHTGNSIATNGVLCCKN